MVLANSYTARSDAYLLLLTETYPPFQDEQTRAAGIEDHPAPGSDGACSQPGLPASPAEATAGAAG